ncbi:MAG: hypothetical protein ABIP93_13830 [Gemmatimonadaceae bacterium]
MEWRRGWMAALIVATAACAAKAPAPVSAVDPKTSVKARRDLITQADLSSKPGLRAQTVLEVVRELRPHFLNERGISSPVADPEAGMVHASVDNGRIVPITELSGMHANDVIEIRYLSASQAMQKFGTAARQGPIILVVTVAN